VLVSAQITVAAVVPSILKPRRLPPELKQRLLREVIS
jgi:acyl-CoA thioesterase FadM